MTIFNILVFFCLLSAFTTCALGFLVHGKNPKSRVNSLFLGSMIAASYWALGEFFFWLAPSFNDAEFWLKVSSFWPVVIVLFAHFILVYIDHPLTRPGKIQLLAAGLYLPAFFFSLLNLWTDATYYVTAHEGPTFIYVANVSSTLYQLESLFIILVMMGATWAGVAAWQEADSRSKKKQVQSICLALGTAIGFGAVSGILFALIDIHTPNLVFIGIFLFSIIITYAINRYGLFTLTMESALPEILKTMPDGLILIDRTGHIMTVNSAAARLFRTDAFRMQGTPATSVLPEAPYQELIEQIRQHESILDFEVNLAPQADAVVSVAGTLVKNSDGAPAGFVLILRDISSRKQEERALRVAKDKISLLSHLTQHDLNNLVTGLSGYLLLLEEDNTTPPASTYLKTAIGVVDKISRHLRFSSEFLNIGIYQPDWQPLRLLIARAINDLSHDGVEITTDVPPVEIYADPLTSKVFYNILENALRHGKNTTAISILARAQEHGGGIILIEDNGGGIPEQEKARIFEYGVGNHTGFGLAFARDILEVTGVSIRETGTPGRGARFEIHVPAVAWRQKEMPAGESSD